jgi:hypothetical protein
MTRYWFQYPPEWTTANVGEKIIGFRSLFIHHMARNMVFLIQFSLPEGELWPDGTESAGPGEGSTPSEPGNETPSEPGNETPSEPGNETINDSLRYIFVQFILLDDWNVFNEAIQNALEAQLGKDYRGLIYAEESYLSTDVTFKDETMIHKEGKHWSYYNVNNTKSGKNNTYGICIHPSINKASKSNLSFIVEPLSDDAKSVLNCWDYVIDENFYDPTHAINWFQFYDVWDRRSCAIKSSIVSGSQNNYLGHTNIRYDPLKYYRINNNDREFSIDLLPYNNNHQSVFLPADDLETLTMEFVILQNATELYT